LRGSGQRRNVVNGVHSKHQQTRKGSEGIKQISQISTTTKGRIDFGSTEKL